MASLLIEANIMIQNLTFTFSSSRSHVGLAALALLSVGCGKGGDDTGDTNGTNTIVDTGETGAELGGFVEGIITSPTGEVVSGARVTMCSAFCRIETSGEDGSYRFDGIAEEDVAFDVEMPDEHWPTILFPLSLGAESENVVDLQMQELGEDVTIPQVASELELLPSFYVTMGFDNIDTGFNSPEMAAASQPTSWAWESLVTLPGTIAGVWYLEPWETKAAGESLQFRLANTWGWEAGSEGSAVVASYDDKSWLDIGALIVSADGEWVTSVEGQSGLPILSTLVILEP